MPSHLTNAVKWRVEKLPIRAAQGEAASGDKHNHSLHFQMVYVLKGWVRFWYENVGKVRLVAGSCVHQPPGIAHRELEHSEDVEMLEITMPAEFETRNLA